MDILATFYLSYHITIPYHSLYASATLAVVLFYSSLVKQCFETVSSGCTFRFQDTRVRIRANDIYYAHIYYSPTSVFIAGSGWMRLMFFFESLPLWLSKSISLFLAIYLVPFTRYYCRYFHLLRRLPQHLKILLKDNHGDWTSRRAIQQINIPGVH